MPKHFCACTGEPGVYCIRCRAILLRANGVIAPPPAVSERAFMQAVRKEALAAGWLFYHTFDARKSAPGFFDCVLAKPGHPLVLSELKTATGIVTLEQQRWYDTVRQATGVECYLWRPENMAEIVEILLRK
jgi:hypothetical protein